jgi:integrase
MLERGTVQLMANKDPTFHLIIKSLEQAVDGSLRLEGIETHPEHAEKELELLEKLLKRSPAPTAPASGKTLQDLVQGFVAEAARASRWTEKTRKRIESSLELFLEIVGPTKPAHELNRAELTRFKDILTKLPSNRSKDARYKGKSAMELSEMKIAPDDLQAVNTINKTIDRVSSLLKWGAVHGYVGANYAEGMALAKSKRADEERAPYTSLEVQTLLKAVSSGAHGSAKAPYMKWVPVMAAYTGMRLNEICQLALADSLEVDGIPVVVITDAGEGQQLKTKNARRTVPLHSALIEEGLLEYVDTLRKRACTRLFPN